MPKYIVSQPAIARCIESRSSKSPITTSAPLSRNACARSSSFRTIALTALPCFNSSSTIVRPTAPTRPAAPVTRIGFVIFPSVLFDESACECTDRGDLHQVNLDVDVPSCGLGIRTRLMRAVQERLRDLTIHTRQADVKTRLEEVTIAASQKINFGINGDIGWQLHLHFLRDKFYRAKETGRPTGRKQLFGVCAIARTAGNGKLYVQPAIRGTGRASVPSAGRVSFGGVEHLHGMGRGALIGHCGRIHTVFFDLMVACL